MVCFVSTSRFRFTFCCSRTLNCACSFSEARCEFLPRGWTFLPRDRDVLINTSNALDNRGVFPCGSELGIGPDDYSPDDLIDEGGFSLACEFEADHMIFRGAPPACKEPETHIALRRDVNLSRTSKEALAKYQSLYGTVEFTSGVCSCSNEMACVYCVMNATGPSDGVIKRRRL